MPVLPDLPLPVDQDLWDACVVRVTAIDPTTGAVVSGVNVEEVTLGVEQISGPAIQVGDPILLGVGL